jgi:molecular chaperone GrpE
MQNPDSNESNLDELEASIEADLEKTREEKTSQTAEGGLDDSENEGLSEEPVVEVLEEKPVDQLAAAQALSRENYDKYLRAVAELDTFKRRAQKERSDLLKYGGESMARDLLEVLDNMERAITAATTAAAGTSASGGEDFISGVKMIAEQFRQTFERHGIKGESGIGKQFDPAKQEALASVPTEGKPSGEVLEEFRKTYFFKDKLLRTGQVVVTAAKSEG